MYRINSINSPSQKPFYPKREGNFMPILFWGNNFWDAGIERGNTVCDLLRVRQSVAFCGLSCHRVAFRVLVCPAIVWNGIMLSSMRMVFLYGLLWS